MKLRWRNGKSISNVFGLVRAEFERKNIPVHPVTLKTFITRSLAAIANVFFEPDYSYAFDVRSTDKIVL